MKSSAGNTRGLIEAGAIYALRRMHGTTRLPRGIPAASLKPGGCSGFRSSYVVCLPRGIPAASLKPGAASQWAVATKSSAGNTRGLIEACRPGQSGRRGRRSSAGNTRGLIEATTAVGTGPGRSSRLPRGIPAASLKLGVRRGWCRPAVGLPRGIPAASLKHSLRADVVVSHTVFRGEYPRPH